MEKEDTCGGGERGRETERGEPLINDSDSVCWQMLLDQTHRGGRGGGAL